jgi:hypothetical protein
MSEMHINVVIPRTASAASGARTAFGNILLSFREAVG